jgi:iron complex transport system permease protein
MAVACTSQGSALLGGLVTAGLVFALARRVGLDAYRLVLVGTALSYLAVALTDWLLTKAALREAAAANVWQTGSLNGRSWEHAVPLALSLVGLVPAALAASQVLAALQFGDDTARGLGVRLALARAVMVLAVALAAFAVSAAGPVQCSWSAPTCSAAPSCPSRCRWAS